MKKYECKYEKLSQIIVGLALLFIAIGLSIITMTALPVFGFVIAVPVFLLAYYFFKAPRSKECTIS